MANILITGGAGFIGSHLVKYHLDKGNNVWAIDNLSSVGISSIEPFLSHPNMRFDEEDICTGPLIDEAVAWSDRIYHMAAIVGMQRVIKFPANTLSNNIRSLERVLQAMVKASKKPRLVIASSSCVYWSNPLEKDGRCSETAVVRTPSGSFLQDSYGISKFANEAMALAYGHQHDFHVTVARFFNTVGVNQTGMYGMVVPNFIKYALKGEPITVYGDGTQTRSFCNAHDTVKALELLIENDGSRGEIYNLGNDEECPILTLAKKVKEKTNSNSEIKFMSHEEAYGKGFVEVTRRRPNIDKLVALTGFRPKWMLDETLDEIIEDIRSKLELESDQSLVKDVLDKTEKPAKST